MPEGPILTSPDLIISSFKREIIFKKPDVKKIFYF
jgi:phosphatidate phosphatase PAH1